MAICEIYTQGNKVIIKNPDSFNPKHILDCGQVFRYAQTQYGYRVISRNHCADIIEKDGNYIIECDNIDYFINYFDLSTDYADIKQKVSINDIMRQAVEYGSGIRILKGDLFEIIISFIISANNNIGRIKRSLELISKELGKDMGGYYAFPELEAFKTADEKFFWQCGCGYRSAYLVNTINILASTQFLSDIKDLTDEQAKDKLKQLKGVGDKVADCIMLFGLKKTAVFPVDTWIDKVYRQNFGGNLKSRAEISKYFVDMFGDLAGYAQQYLFYYKRSFLKG